MNYHLYYLLIIKVMMLGVIEHLMNTYYMKTLVGIIRMFKMCFCPLRDTLQKLGNYITNYITNCKT